MTREQAIRTVAKKLASFDKYTFQVAPTVTQQRVEARYEHRARAVIETIEQAQQDFRWRES